MRRDRWIVLPDLVEASPQAAWWVSCSSGLVSLQFVVPGVLAGAVLGAPLLPAPPGRLLHSQ